MYYNLLFTFHRSSLLYFLFLSLFYIFQVIRYKQNIVKHDDTDEIICPPETTFLQFVGDNTDHDLVTVDGKNTHHGLGSIAIANSTFSNSKIMRQTLPRDKKQSWSDITSMTGIKIKQYNPPDSPAIENQILHPLDEDIFSNCSLVRYLRLQFFSV